jgi:phosphoribosylformylglycinamidine cyclo-ligase
VLPKDCDAAIATGSWKVPAIFEHIGRAGKVDRAEMYQVFNMGIGMVLIVGQSAAPAVLAKTRGCVIGRIVPGTGIVKLN